MSITLTMEKTLTVLILTYWNVNSITISDENGSSGKQLKYNRIISDKYLFTSIRPFYIRWSALLYLLFRLFHKLT